MQLNSVFFKKYNPNPNSFHNAAFMLFNISLLRIGDPIFSACHCTSVHIHIEDILKLLTVWSIPHAMMSIITEYLEVPMLSLTHKHLHIVFPLLGTFFCPPLVT